MDTPPLWLVISTRFFALPNRSDFVLLAGASFGKARKSGCPDFLNTQLRPSPAKVAKPSTGEEPGVPRVLRNDAPGLDP